GKYVAGGMVVHNKGCFLPETLILKADGTQSEISAVREGDELLSFGTNGEITVSKVREIIELEAEEYFEIKTPGITVKATAEHPFYSGVGIFRTADSLRPGDIIYAYDGSGLSASPVLSVEKIKKTVNIYNLKTDSPNTFFANYAAVHNKGGGCFPAGVKIETPGGAVPIENLKAGDAVYGFSEGGLVETKVKEVFAKADSVLTVFTDKGALRTTAEHPLLCEEGFINAGETTLKNRAAFYAGGKRIWAEIKGFSEASAPGRVYNLSVEFPNTFIADGFIVHNKGFSGGYHGRGGRSSPASNMAFLVFAAVFWGVSSVMKRRGGEKGELDYLFPRNEIERKAVKTGKLLRFLARQDGNFNPEALIETVKKTFENLQICWSNREYLPMKNLVMDHLFHRHEVQLAIMKDHNEINVMEDVSVLAVDIIGLRYTSQQENRFFTALITAKAKDYYIDDRDNSFLRGSRSAEEFQEFWIFRFMGGKWLLDKIEQTAESDCLTQEDFMETFTDDALAQIYGEAVSKVGPAGPALATAVLGKGVKVERMLNFLGESDKMWNKRRMELDSCMAFLSVYEAWTRLDGSVLPSDYLFPEISRTLVELMEQKKSEKMSFEFRNLCIRKVDIVLVNNKASGGEDEFVARISAHAQKKMIKENMVLHDDGYVTAFTEYWTFGKGEKNWKLKEILARAAGENALDSANKDADSSPMQLEWYYTKKRPY
ncbi:MAG: hypothetical protein COT17_03660, partial [Elusimicrobia bacterium CG08_land_8_20_14_0_20_51_18]